MEDENELNVKVFADKREIILEEAKKCVCGKREQDYGTPENNFNIIAKYWSLYKGVKFTPHDVSMMMALLKVARIQNGGGSGDSYVDLCGYAAIAGELNDKVILE